VARPGDLDLDFDIEGTIIHSVIRNGNEFIITAAGGHGRWADDGHGSRRSEIDEVASVELCVGYAADSDLQHCLVERVAEQFDGWCAKRVPLHVVSAPAKLSLMVDPIGRELVLPRGGPP
jgi:hypothetical protein